jgi:predicted nucleic acid-binding Zn ribbon protein
MSTAMEEINNILKDVFKSLSSNNLDISSNVQDSWTTILNDQENQHSEFVSLNNDQICVAVDSSAWLFHFRSNKPRLLKQINQKHPRIKNLQFKLRCGP